MMLQAAKAWDPVASRADECRSDQGRGAQVPWADRRLDRDILLMTIVVWGAHLGIITTRSYALGMFAGDFALVARVLVACFGAASTLAIYLGLRTRELSPTRRFATALALSIPACLLLSFLNEILWLLMTPYYPNRYDMLPTAAAADRMDVILQETIYTAAFYTWVFVSWCALYVGAVSSAQVRERDGRLARAEDLAHRAQLTALQFQISPHFLFNTLNTLSGLVAMRAHAQAERVILCLSDFMRHTLTRAPISFVTLAEELETQRIYLEIESARFGSRLVVRRRIEPGCGEVMVPWLILQPLVENAVKHGVAPSTEPVALQLSAARRDDRLVLSVANGPPSFVSETDSKGLRIGIQNVQQRLLALYGETATLSAGPTEDGGWLAEIVLPWRTGTPNS